MALTLAVDLEHPADRPLVLAAEVIQAGGVIVYPTETIYGIGANAWDGTAIAKVRALKHRTDQKPILVIVRSREQLILRGGRHHANCRALHGCVLAWPSDARVQGFAQGT